ncbi:MAG: dipeptidase [Vulcanimicrobiota bacterium]
MDAQDLIHKHFFCDGHADTLARVAFAGADFVGGRGTDYFNINLEALQQGGVNLQLMAVYIPPEIPRHQGTVTALWITQVGHRVVDELAGEMALVTDRQVLEACVDDGKPHFLMTLEGVSPLLDDLDVLEIFFRFGIRSIGLTHNHNNGAAGGCKPPDGKRYGLTDFGRTLVQRMEELGIMLDMAHLSHQAFYDLMDVVTKPFVNTHCCCRALVDTERNMSDDQLKLLAKSGGVAAITYVPDFLSHEHHSKVTSHDVFRHLEHAANLIGIDHVALGSDFDGVRFLPTDLRSPLETVNIVQRMLDAGWSEEDIAKVLGGNWLRVLRQVLPESAGFAEGKRSPVASPGA